MKKLLPILLCLTLLTGCSGGTIYSNYREPSLLTVIRCMGFDRLSDGRLLLSVSSGADNSPTDSSCLSAAAESVSAAREKLSDYSTSEQLFFAHASYFAVGEQTARTGLMPILDYIARVPDLRLDEPIFVVTGATASELITGAVGKAHDATSVFASLERSSRINGDFRVFTVSELIAALDINGCALMTAIRPVKAADAVEGAGKDELTALPDGYAVLKDGAMLGKLPPSLAPGVGLLTNKAGPEDMELTVDTSRVTLSLDNCVCDVVPVIENSELTALDIRIKLRTALRELDGDVGMEAAEAALAAKVRGLCASVLEAERTLGCDFLQLGAVLERREPKALRGIAAGLSQKLTSLQYIIHVDATVTRSFDLF